MSEKPMPLIIVGLDSAEPYWLQRGAREGWLPTLAGLLERGCSARVNWPPVMTDVPLWTATWHGQPLQRIGWYNQFQVQPGTYEFTRMSHEDVQGEPFWGWLRGSGLRVAVLDALHTRLVPGLQGIQFMDWATHEGDRAPAADPPGLLDEVQQVYGPQIVALEKPGGSAEESQRLFHLLLQRVEKKGAVIRHLLGRQHFDLAVINFSETHTITHQFWPGGRGAASAGEPAGAEGDAEIRALYAAIDRAVASVLAQAPAETNVVLFSPMGVADHYPINELMEKFCQQLGYHVLRPAGGGGSLPRALIRRLIPLHWRDRLRRGLPPEAQERLAATKYVNITDWQRTTAYAIPSQFEGMIRVNLRGREPAGVVEPGAEYERALQNIAEDLKQLTDPRTGAAAVSEVIFPALADGTGPPEILPDVLALFKPVAHFLDRLQHPRAELRQSRADFHRSNTHTRSGLLLAAGPTVGGRGPVDDMDLLDLAPTFLRLLGQPVPAELPGRANAALLGE